MSAAPPLPPPLPLPNTHACTPPQGLLWETSLLDADEGIRMRGYSLPELQVRTYWADERPAKLGVTRGRLHLTLRRS